MNLRNRRAPARRRSPDDSPTARDARDPGACVEVNDVHVAFGANKVLRGVSVRVARGETVAILGESGSGKTVLLKVILGLLRPDRGDARLFGEPLAGRSDDELIPIRKRCSVVYQGGALFSGLNVGENIALELKEVLRLPDDEVTKRVREALDAVGLGDVNVEAAPDELSGGMRKRLAVARAVAPRPEMIVYDEPTSGLDPLNSARILTLIKDLHDRFHVTSVVVTHDVNGACAIADRILFLAGGKLAFDGSPATFQASEDDAVVAFRTSTAGHVAAAGTVR